VNWGICTTVKAPADQVLAFSAHHLGLGAARIWLFFDDPDDPAADAVAGLDRVTVTRCTDEYWHAEGRKRPDRHQNRQARNMQAVYAQAAMSWVAHIDVDEFLAPDQPIAAVLASLPPDQPMLRMAPWEALHDPALHDDIFTARHFRATMKGPKHQAARDVAFGLYAPLLPDGVLSHAAGKCFFRSGVSRMEPRLHGAFRAGARVDGGPFDPRIALLHFHAENPARWQDRLQFRLSRGAYQYNPALQAHLLAASADDIAAFYARVQTPDAAALADLAKRNLLHTANLDLRAQTVRLGQSSHPARASHPVRPAHFGDSIQ